jgi:hypothetical protein
MADRYACVWSLKPRLRDRFTNQKSSIALGLRCVYCLSFWFALPVICAARMVAEEDGPAFVFKRLRDAHTESSIRQSR